MFTQPSCDHEGPCGCYAQGHSDSREEAAGGSSMAITETDCPVCAQIDAATQFYGSRTYRGPKGVKYTSAGFRPASPVLYLRLGTGL